MVLLLFYFTCKEVPSHKRSLTYHLHFTFTFTYTKKKLNKMKQKLDYGHFTLNLTSTTSYYKGVCVCVQERHTMRGRRTEEKDKETKNEMRRKHVTKPRSERRKWWLCKGEDACFTWYKTYRRKYKYNIITEAANKQLAKQALILTIQHIQTVQTATVKHDLNTETRPAISLYISRSYGPALNN